LAVENLTRNTIGVDLGDRFSHLCVLDAEAKVIEESRVRTEPSALRAAFSARVPSRVVMEVGTQSAWISREIQDLGHEVWVANPRRVKLISASDNKSDRQDAEILARLGRMDPQLLHPIRHRGAQTLADREVLRARAALVSARTQLVNHARSAVKVAGGRLPSSSTESFPRKVAAAIPESLRPALEPILAMVDALNTALGDYDREIEALGNRYPETQRLRQVQGVGPVTSLLYVLTLEDPDRFPKSRAVGAYLGLRPRRQQSGDMDRQMRITKAGDRELRSLLVQCAHYILGPLGPDTDLKRFGLRLAERGGKAAKKRAAVAVARKLAVLLHQLWITEQAYEPLRKDLPTGPTTA
jgi:transposase